MESKQTLITQPDGSTLAIVQQEDTDLDSKQTFITQPDGTVALISLEEGLEQTWPIATQDNSNEVVETYVIEQGGLPLTS